MRCCAVEPIRLTLHWRPTRCSNRARSSGSRAPRLATTVPSAWSGDRRAPIWLLGPRVHRHLEPLPGKPPYELQDVFRLAADDGAVVSAIQVGATRGLTSPADVVRENFPYLR